LEPSAQYDFNKTCEFLTLLSSIDAQRAEVLAQHQTLSLTKMGAILGIKHGAITVTELASNYVSGLEPLTARRS
jgi:hypothetical protein